MAQVPGVHAALPPDGRGQGAQVRPLRPQGHAAAAAAAARSREDGGSEGRLRQAGSRLPGPLLHSLRLLLHVLWHLRPGGTLLAAYSVVSECCRSCSIWDWCPVRASCFFYYTFFWI